MNKYTIIAILILLSVAIFLGIKNNKEVEPIIVVPEVIVPTDTPKSKMVTGSDLETFSGTITAVDTGCFYDAICSVSVDGKKIVLVKGGRGLPPDTVVGKLIGVESIGDLESKIGKHANVYAGVIAEGEYSIYGNDKYYVEVIDIIQ